MGRGGGSGGSSQDYLDMFQKNKPFFMDRRIIQRTIQIKQRTNGARIIDSQTTQTYYMGMQCPLLHCTEPHCTSLHCTALHRTVLYCTVLYCTVV